ncbi:MAG: hypothetical protein FJ197_04970 [Gammaproteobacteria bacterium]|nr:hypothetical protein [Gammaproteobacteria bacterium]
MSINKSNLISLPWLTAAARQLQAPDRSARAAQALLIYGPRGTGRRRLAMWHAAGLLGGAHAAFEEFADSEPPAASDDSDAAGETLLLHPDFLALRPAAGKSAISIEAVRSLIDFLHLRSLRGGARVAAIWPADAMTMAAANSLLKTLEEPPDGATIILVADELSRLPPTILSRCQRLRIATPVRAQSLPWLLSQAPAVRWEPLLDLAGDAPIAALAMQQKGLAERFEAFAADLDHLGARRDTPVAVAARWATLELEVTLRWLYRRVAAEIRNTMLGSARAPLLSPAKGLTMRDQWGALRETERMLRFPGKAVNVELQLALLLRHWYPVGNTGNAG